MKQEGILIPAKITREVFRRFAFFDAFYHQKHWQRPLVFALLMSAFSVPCFLLRDRRQGAVLLGAVLLVVGLGLPLAYLLSFALSLRRQMKRMDLRGERIAYTLRLESAGVHVTAGTETADYPWETVHMVYRVPGCDYLYVGPRQAYLLPHGASAEKVWGLLESALPREKRKTFKN